MSDPNAGTAPESLQFDRAVDAAAPAPDAQQGEPAPFITCSNCQAQVKTYYYNVDDNAVCAKCKQEIARTSGAQTRGRAWIKAAIFGFAAAIVGAVIYYGVIAITNFEIGIVAILIGWIVGVAIRRGAAGGGGRRYQILAIALTYFSVGLAYSPLVFKGFLEGRDKAVKAIVPDSTKTVANPDDAENSDSAAVADSTIADADSSTEAAPRLAGSPVGSPKGARKVGVLGVLLAIGATFLFIFALPVIAVVTSLPSGIISALIIGVGMRTAWRMTQGHVISITGPYKVGDLAQAAPVTG